MIGIFFKKFNFNQSNNKFNLFFIEDDSDEETDNRSNEFLGSESNNGTNDIATSDGIIESVSPIEMKPSVDLTDINKSLVSHKLSGIDKKSGVSIEMNKEGWRLVKKNKSFN